MTSTEATDQKTINKYKINTIIYASLFLGSVPQVVFMVFLFLGPFHLFDFGLTDIQALIFDTFLSFLFFIQHSVLVRRSIRQKLSRLIPDVYYSSFYAITSGIFLTLPVIFWQEVQPPLFTAEGILYWLLRVIFLLSMAGFYWGIRSLGAFDPFGARQLRRYLYHKTFTPMPLTIKGAYRWVRHPLYFFMLLVIWAGPVVTADKILFNILWTAWLFIGAVLEECDLVDVFGDFYRQYQARVPMIIPNKIPQKKNFS